MDKIFPVLLAGGLGTRLWPLSRKSYPKQFSKIIGKKTPFQMSALRTVSSDILDFGPHITLTNSDYRFIVTEQLMSINIDPGPILIEPEQKNTAPSILAASIFAYKRDNEAILLISPSDHFIQDIERFHQSIKIGIKEVNKNKIILFGVKPSSAETGYGYIELENDKIQTPSKIKKFIEKPSKPLAKKMLCENKYLWNAGIFLFKAKVIMEEFKHLAPEIYSFTEKSVLQAKSDLGFLRLDQKNWSLCQKISVDYAIMEKSNNICAVPFSTEWTDMGNWQAVWKLMKPDKNNVVVSENAFALNCKNTLLRSDGDNQVMVGLGLKDIVAVSMPDAVIVANKNMTSKISDVVEILENKKITQANDFPKNHRPWGCFETLSISKNFKVKKIIVKAGASLSLQSHQYRAEHWVVVKGKVKVKIDKKTSILSEGESTYVPTKTVHRLENPYKVEAIIIEIQTGTYFGEDDIIRYEDLYSRK